MFLLAPAAPVSAREKRACTLLAKAARTRAYAEHRRRNVRAPDPVYPEDGSLPLKIWFTSPKKTPDVINSEKLKRILEEQDAAFCDIDFDYEWIQDVAIFSSQGKLLLQADMPPDQDILIGLTLGVLNSGKYGIDPMRLTPQHAKALGLPYRRMRWTLVEGGEMITGRFPSGETYAVIDEDVVLRAQAYYAHLKGRALSAGGARRLISRDLGISPRNLFPVASGGIHLDVMLTALPGGVLLLQDYGKTLEVLDRLLAAELPPAERRRLRRMRDFHTRGFRYLDPLATILSEAGDSGERVFRPFDAAEEKGRFERIAAALGGRFKLVRAAGIFKELKENADPLEDRNEMLFDRINFFNGFVGADAGGRLFVVTNTANELPSLENYWRDLLGRHGIAPERVHFLGYFDDGAGIDCAGASSG